MWDHNSDLFPTFLSIFFFFLNAGIPIFFLGDFLFKQFFSGDS